MFRKVTLSLALTGLLAMTGSALADGLPGTYAAPVARGYSWSGLYLGANAGYQWSDVERQYTPIAGVPAAQLHLLQHPAGGIYGGHVGYQHQFGSLVLGVEGGLSGTRHRGGAATADAPFFAPFFDASSRLDNVLQLGGRVGWALSDKWLVYASGGIARATIHSEFWFRPAGPATASTSQSHNNGWYIGGGVDYRLSKDWIIGLEYEHLSLDSACAGQPFGNQGCRALGGFLPATTHFNTADTDVVRARLSFIIGPDPAPVVPLK